MIVTERLAEIKADLSEIFDTGELSLSEIAGLSDTTATLVAALESVRELHQPFEWSFGFGPVQSCKHCAEQGANEEKAHYPCPTVEAINEHLRNVVH